MLRHTPSNLKLGHPTPGNGVLLTYSAMSPVINCEPIKSASSLTLALALISPTQTLEAASHASRSRGDAVARRRLAPYVRPESLLCSQPTFFLIHRTRRSSRKAQATSFKVRACVRGSKLPANLQREIQRSFQKGQSDGGCVRRASA
jgi:hypothetical protein